MTSRRYRGRDLLLSELDQALSTLFGRAPSSGRASPSAALSADESALAAAERRLSTRLMRVNHTGEVCAQALYQGQALTAQRASLRQTLRQAALEEGDHLRWCQQRLEQLDGRASVLNPLFYLGSWTLGAAAGLAGDRWSLGFLVETERQVERHLGKHLDKLPPQDQRSRDILSVMQQDEARHAADAETGGAAPLPTPLRLIMSGVAKIMTKTSYWL